MEINQKVKDFFIKLGEDEELREKLEAASKRQDLAECALLSRDAGFDFTRADLEYMVNLAQAYQNGQLSDDQLELVSGGFVGSGIILATLITAALFGVVATITGTGGIIAASVNSKN